MNISACCFIKDTFTGAFCLWESMAPLLPFVDEYIIMDLGSTDGTLETLREIESTNPKVRVMQGNWPTIDSGAFATLANDVISLCSNDVVIYHQADEIWHQDLLRLMKIKLEAGGKDLSFWRIQYANNFQYVKWFPHVVHRVGIKGAGFYFVGDGMNTNRYMDAKICSDYGGEFFPQWGQMGQDGIKPYTNQMIMDVSLLGGFRDNIIERRAKHAPFWHEEPTIPYYDNQTGQQPHLPAGEWMKKAMGDDDWTSPIITYNLPQIMRYHVGKVKYELRPELLEAIKADDTRRVIGL